MSQDTVCEFLKRNRGRWYGLKEIAKAINLGTSSTSNNLRKLRKDPPSNFKSKQVYKKGGYGFNLQWSHCIK